MEKPQTHHNIAKKLSLFPLLFLLQFSSLFLTSFSYEIPQQFFINSGSDEAVPQGSRSFIGDEKPASFSVTKQGSFVTKNTNQTLNNTLGIYNTARIFTRESSYAFKTASLDKTTYLVRLHFLAFASRDALGSAFFDVKASPGVFLLRNFRGDAAKNAPVVKEFYVAATTRQFRIYFTPGNASFAFVNGVEFFPAPPVNFDVREAGKVDENFAESSVFQTVYRINVGGDKVEPIDDMLWRTWETDDPFLQNKLYAINAPSSNKKPVYIPEDSRFNAPNNVYQTAKEMNYNTSSNSSSEFNITWGFEVNKSSSHYVRAHFFDIVSNSNGLEFNLYFNGDFMTTINSIENTSDPNSALFFDFGIGSRNSNLLTISISPTNLPPKNAILNGLEILEIKEGLASIPRETEGQRKSKLPVVIGAVSGGLVLVLALGTGFFVVAKRRKTKKPVETSIWGQVPGFGGGSTHSRVTETTINGSLVPHLYLGLKLSLSEIMTATKNFNSKLVIGKGGFGIVYKGTLQNGTLVAVKRSAQGSGQGLFEFETEITILSKIRHRHLVSLIGYCDEKSEMILVYEFMEKGTLRDHLYGSNLPRLSWKQRLEICLGSASGLEYLHKGSSSGIIHRDIKSTNILLDSDYVAKVADFGLSKSSPLEDTHVSTNIKGTLGYVDPEYFRTQQLTEKSDVYSFGVVLLEVLCARAAIDVSLPREAMNLAEWAMRCKSKGMIEDIIDPEIKGQVNMSSVRKFAETAEKCLHEEGVERPTMSDVKWDLEYALQLQRMPVPREPHEDSTINTSTAGFSEGIMLPDVQRLVTLESVRDESGELERDFSEVSGGSDVFSQLKMDGAR